MRVKNDSIQLEYNSFLGILNRVMQTRLDLLVSNIVFSEEAIAPVDDNTPLM